MVTRRDARIWLASISFVALFGVVAAGCGGDDTPSQADGGSGGKGGSGGSGGKGGDAGIDSKTDADAGDTANDRGDTGDLPTDRGDTGETGDLPTDRGETGDVPTDRGDTGETGDLPSDRGETGETGDSGSGGAGTGGAGGSGGDAGQDVAVDVPADVGVDVPVETAPEVAPACYTVAFERPTDNLQLFASDDQNMDQCGDGFTYDVRITSSAPDGTIAVLSGGTTTVMATVTGGRATFNAVPLTTGDHTLSVQFPTTMPCAVQVHTNVNCDKPTCTINKPGHTTLNGMPASGGGDRTSASNAPYAINVEVGSSISDGNQVTLDITNTDTAAVTMATGAAMSLKASFTDVALVPDGNYRVVATCKDSHGVTATAQQSFIVDSTPPTLTLTTGGLCGSTQQTTGQFTSDVAFATDATDIKLTLTNGATVRNLTNPTLGVGTATFAGVVFDQDQTTITATATDAAGNVTTLTTTPSPCVVTVGGAPSVTFTTPSTSPPHALCATGTVAAGCVPDSKPASGWQGDLVVHVTAGATSVEGVNVTFKVSTASITSTVIGTAVITGGNATLSIMDADAIPEDDMVTFTATTDPVPGHGAGTGSVIVNVDSHLPAVPGIPTATAADIRQTSFQMVWTAPGDTGRTLAGYQVRVARVPIDASNFDNAGVTTAVTYSAMPQTDGNIDGLLIKNLTIEQDYYFAVAAVDGVGNRGPIASSQAAASAHFRTKLLTGNGSDKLGFAIEGSGDLGQTNGALATDGISDLVVGGYSSKTVYIYFGASGNPGGYTSPGVTITGTTAGFGSDVVDVGDIDGDQLDDLAIGSPTESKVYIYSRKNPPISWGTAWPMTLTQADAKYVITLGGANAGAYFGGGGIARLGNFDGAGADDFAIGLGGDPGLVLIVKGQSSFPSAITTPDATNTIEIDSNTNGSFFGLGVMGIGQFYPPPAGPTLIGVAAGTGTSYAYPGQAPAGPLTLANASDKTTGDANFFYGVNFGYLGPIAGISAGAVTLGAPDASYVDLHMGTVGTGPFPLDPVNPLPTPQSGFLRITTNASGVSFGVVNLGTGVRGTSTSLSLIGNDTVPDLILAGQSMTGKPVYVLSGAALSTMTGTLDVEDLSSSIRTGLNPGLVKIVNPGAIPFSGYTVGLDSMIIDSNGDGYPDFAIGEQAFSGPGRVVIFY